MLWLSDEEENYKSPDIDAGLVVSQGHVDHF